MIEKDRPDGSVGPGEPVDRPFRLAEWLIDPAACWIERGGEGVHLEPKVMQVLTHLAAQPGTVVSRQELEDSVWAGTVVGYDAVTNAIIKLRKALGDDARHPQIIETISKRGYRLIGEVAPLSLEATLLAPNHQLRGREGSAGADSSPSVEVGSASSTVDATPAKRGRPARLIALIALIIAVAGGLAWWSSGGPDVEPASLARMAYPLPDKPSIVVLPFNNLSVEESNPYLADAMTEILIATLGQVPELFVIARHSAFAYKGQTTDVRQVSQELGVRHVLEGSVQQSDDQIRVTAQLIDATTGEHLWAEHYDRPLDDFFSLQDEIALKILISLQGKLTEGGDAALRSSSTDNVQAYLRFQKGLNVFFKRTKDAHIEAGRLFDEALELDPAFAMPRMFKAWIHIIGVWYGFYESPDDSLAAAEAEIDRIGNFEDESVSAVIEGEATMARATIALLRGQHDLALELGRKSIELIPGYADALAHYGAMLLNAGQLEDAVQMLRRGMRLSPQYESWQPRLLSIASTLSGDHDGAVAAGKDAIDRAESDSNRALGHMVLAIAYAEADMVELARNQVARARELRPDMTLDRYRAYWVAFRNQSDMERILGALRAAGLPE